jgi:hypothetical protein
MAEVTKNESFAGNGVLAVSAGVAVVGWAGSCLGFFVARADMHFAYLTAFAFVASVTLGALVFLMTAYLVEASWSVVIRRLNEAVVSVFPLLALLFLPIALGVDQLYSWADPLIRWQGPELETLRHKQAYLNVPSFLGRSVFYFLIWCLSARKLRLWSLDRDKASASALGNHQRERAFSAVVLPFVGLTLTFASFDWLMSLEPFWSSTIFGVYFFAGGFVANFGLLAILAFAAQRSGLSHGLLRPPHFHALGRLMFAFTIFWAYIAFFQALLIRIANRPEEVAFYAHRLADSWQLVAWFLVIGRFLLPVLVLLPQSIKFRPGAMALVGAWLLIGQYIDISWLVLPVHSQHGPLLAVWDLLALMAVCGTSAAYAAFRLRGAPIVPLGDPILAESVAYRSPL